jgi:uncharacterized protein
MITNKNVRSKEMKKWYLVIGLVLVLMVFGLVGCSSQASTPQPVTVANQQEGISVNGEGKVSVVPDIASLSLGVQSQETSVASAQAKATEAMNKVLSALSAGGIADKDIQTSRFSIQVVSKYDNLTQQSTITGYMVTNTVNVKIRTIEKTGAIIDAVASAGGDFTRINSISFTVEDPTPYYTQAREKAVADAQAKSEQLAKLAGITRGKPTFISESVASPVPQPIQSALPSGAGASISPGELLVTANVQVVYAIIK